MKDKLKSIINPLFLVSLAILLLNDFYLKSEYHNWITGKLSDFCGLFVFASFWEALLPNRKKLVYVSTALLFVFWKSPFSQSFINFFSENLYPIYRVIDATDLIALLVLPIAFYANQSYSFKPKPTLNPVPLAILSIFAFCATSMPSPTQTFEQPQYLLFKSGSIDFDNIQSFDEFEVYKPDSFLIVEIRSVRLDSVVRLDDEFHKVQILRRIDLYLLRESERGYRLSEITDYVNLRDSLVIPGKVSITLKHDSIRDELNFKNSRLDGDFKRFLNDNLAIAGRYKNGIEDSTWNFYNGQGEMSTKKVFSNGELVKLDRFEKSIIVSQSKFNTRKETIRNKWIHIVIVALIALGLCWRLYLNFKKFRPGAPQKISFSKIIFALLLSVCTLLLAKTISSFIPNSYSTISFGILGEVILVQLILTPLFLFIFYVLKLRSKLDLLYYVLLISFLIVLIEEVVYLAELGQF